MGELILGILVCAASAALSAAGAKRGAAVAAIVTTAAICAAAIYRLETSHSTPLTGAELLAPEPSTSPAGYRSSVSCRPCHPKEYRTWRESYHRTMTQVVTPETAIGDFQDLTLYFDGRPYGLSRTEDRLWVELSDPDQVDQALAIARSGDLAGAQEFARQIPRVRRQLVVSTGSHHYQLYWYPSGRGDELYMLPFVYLREEQRWLPRVSVFLTPPNQLEPRKVWNRDCLPCHSTGGVPGYGPGEQSEPNTALAEPGIACEACHGPGREHVAANRSLLRRYRLHLSDGADETVVQPVRLEGERASQVCGQCHSVHTQYNGEDWEESFASGSPYVPGADLSATHYIVQPDTLEQSPLMTDFVRRRPGALDEWFWNDGEIRVVGREYNGLVDSPCYQGGEFGCLSCHAMHESAPEDQLKPGMRGDQACLQCHSTFETRIAEHSHHPAESSGARCQNCHTPHTTYGLLKASRSHRVSSPSIAVNLSTGRPNACNLCHLDETLAWTAAKLEEWYGLPAPALDSAESSVPAGALWLLRGDAGVRAIAAWHAGWPDAQQTAGTDWIPTLLAPLLDDPYDAVRFIAARSMRSLRVETDLRYDFLDSPDARRAAIARVPSPRATNNLPASLFQPDGTPRFGVIEDLLSQRDERPVYLVE